MALLQKPLFQYFLCFVAGCLITLSLAPFNIWPLSIIAVASLLYVIQQSTIKQAFFSGWMFGFGQFLSGVAWVYISIHDQSQTPAILAVPMTVGLCAFIGLFAAGFGYVYRLLFQQHNFIFNILLAPSVWFLFDWIRSWILTGFPWLYIGHSQTTSWLSGYVPIGGVYLASFILCLCAALLVNAIKQQRTMTWLYSALIVCLISLGSFFLKPLEWTQATGKSMNVTMIQANIPQQEKWLPQFRQIILDRYKNMLTDNLSNDHLYIFPETALPASLFELESYFAELESVLTQNNSGLITGLVTYDQKDRTVYNSMLSLSKAQGVYHKQHLVPFGEYVPFEWIRKLGDVFNLPMSNFTPSTEENLVFKYKDFIIAPFICYEIIFPAMVRKYAQQSDVLLTVSNDTWFGRSLAQVQHMQIAQARALETGRYLIRSTNNGISGIVNEKGIITAQMKRFEQDVMSQSIPSFSGTTPYIRLGDWPLLIFVGAMIALATFSRLAFYRHL